MTHCDPAPPNPDSGEIINAVCWDWTMFAVLIGVIVIISVVMHFVRDHDTDGSRR